MNQPIKLAVAAALLAATAGAFASQDDNRPDNAWIAHDVATLPHYATVLIVANSPVLTRDPIAFFATDPAPVPMAAADESVYFVVPGATTDTVYFYSEPVYYIAGPVTDMTASIDTPVNPN